MGKETKALETITEGLHCSIYERDNHMYDKEINIIKSALEQKEKLEKFVEIIKNKPQQYAYIRRYNIKNYVDTYYCPYEDSEKTLTETEFNLLKETM